MGGWGSIIRGSGLWLSLDDVHAVNIVLNCETQLIVIGLALVEQIELIVLHKHISCFK